MDQQDTPSFEEIPESSIRGIEEVIISLKSGAAGWGDLMNFTERSFYELNNEFDTIREHVMEMEEAGNFDAAQHQMKMADFFVSARDNSIILNVLARLGTEIENINQRLDTMEEKLK